MSFFEPPPPPPEPPQPVEMPEWLGPPDNVIPGAFPLELVLARTEDVAVFVEHGRAFPNGWQFTFGLLLREHDRHPHHHPMVDWHTAPGEISDDAVRFGIALADGRKATVFDRPAFPGQDGPAPDVVLRPGGGGGGGGRWERRFWAWPLPPEGPVAFVVEWPKRGIELTRTEIDSEPIRAAATRALEVWPEQGPQPGRGWVRAR